MPCSGGSSVTARSIDALLMAQGRQSNHAGIRDASRYEGGAGSLQSRLPA